MKKVLLVDDHNILLEGLTLLIDTIPEYRVIDQLTKGKEAILYYKKNKPDIVLLDLQLPDINGIEICKKIVDYDSDAKVIILTSFNVQRLMIEAAKAGAKGFITKDIAREDLISIFSEVVKGRNLLEKYKYKKDSVLDEIETEIMIKIAEGKTNSEIANEMWFGKQTIKNYVSRILKKLDLNNRAEIASYVTKNNLQMLKKSN